MKQPSSTPLDIVVARYAEEVGWIGNLDAVRPRVWLYNKGGESPQRPSLPLPNIGREAHTYLYHIVNHWDDLADRTVFCQGRPHDHAEHFVDDVLMYAINPAAEPFRWFGQNLADGVRLVQDDLNGHPHDTLPIGEYAKDFGVHLEGQYVRFSPGACFAVSRGLIRSMPRSFYASLLDDMEKRPGRRQPWILERLWGYIFNTKTLDSTSRRVNIASDK